MDKEGTKFKRYWSLLNDLIETSPKKTIDYDELWKVRGEGMETDIPYKDTLFTVVANHSFMKKTNRICFRKNYKTNFT